MTRLADGPARQRPLASAVHEILLIAGLFGLYECGRRLSSRPARADRHAISVWHFERWTHLPSEAALQSPLLTRPHLAEAVNGYYAWVHFPVTVVVLVCLWWRRPGEYRSIRTVMAILTFSALLVHFAFPLAPPRMLTSHGMVDLARRYGPAVYGAPTRHSLSDQYAAMPSLHVAWAAVVALVVIRLLRSRWRWLALAYPATTTAVVLVTGNHYWVDAFVGLALLGASTVVAPRSPAHPRRALVRAHSPSPEPACAAERTDHGRALDRERNVGDGGDQHLHRRARPAERAPAHALFRYGLAERSSRLHRRSVPREPGRDAGGDLHPVVDARGRATDVGQPDDG